jgi:hypothetical protein
MLTGVSLPRIAMRGVELYTGTAPSVEVTTFSEFDSFMGDRMVGDLPGSYKPDYLAMQMFNFPPFYDSSPSRTPTNWMWEISGPLWLHEDGRYALERTLRHFESSLVSPSSEIYYEEGLITAAGLALGALSAVAQNRLGTSLNEAALMNIAKLENRKKNDTLEDGAGIEDFRPPWSERPRLGGFDVTLRGLVFSPRPE